jgi:hypothetical protein
MKTNKEYSRICHHILLFVNLLADQQDPNGKNFQTRLTDGICQACHVSQFFTYPLPTTGLNLKNLGFIPTYPMTLSIFKGGNQQRKTHWLIMS